MPKRPNWRVVQGVIELEARMVKGK